MGYPHSQDRVLHPTRCTHPAWVSEPWIFRYGTCKANKFNAFICSGSVHFIPETWPSEMVTKVRLECKSPELKDSHRQKVFWLPYRFPCFHLLCEQTCLSRVSPKLEKVDCRCTTPQNSHSTFWGITLFASLWLKKGLVLSFLLHTWRSGDWAGEWHAHSHTASCLPLKSYLWVSPSSH